MGKKMRFEMFSDARVGLMKEVKEHPALIEKLASYPVDEEHWPERLGEIAAHVMVVVDGMYMPSELERLYEILYWKLRGKRTGVAIVTSNELIH